MIGRSIAIVLTGYVALVNLQLSAGTLAEKCLLTVAEGNCSESLQRWFFNNRTGICQSFVYRGCNGNANNFNSTEYCYHACNVSADEPHSYSLSDKIKGGRAAAASNAVSNSGPSADTVTPPTTFEPTAHGAAPAGQNSGSSSAASANTGNLASTREPTLITQPANPTTKSRQPVTPSGTGSSSDSAHTPAAGAGAAPSPSRSKRSTSSKSRRHQTSDEHQEVDDEESKPTEESDETDNEVTPVPKKSKSRQHGSTEQRQKKTKTAPTAADNEENDVVEKVSKKKKSTVIKKNDAAREGREDKDAIEELVAHMESTADKLQKIASIAKSAKKTSAHKTSTGNDEEDDSVKEHDEEKNKKETGDKEVEEEEKKEAEETGEQKKEKSNKHASKRRHQHSRKRTNSKKSSAAVATRSGRKTSSSKGGRKVIDVTVVSGDAIVERRTGSKLAELLRMGLEEGRKTLLNDEKTKDGEVDEADDDEIEVIGERIKTIIYDPSYVFSYTNISSDDLVSLQEIISQSDVGTLQLIEKDESAVNKSEHVAIAGEEHQADTASVTGMPQEVSSEKSSAGKTETASVEGQEDSEKVSPKDNEEPEMKDKHDVVAATTEK